MLPALMLALATSCTTPKNITYMQGFDTDEVQKVAAQRRITIQPDDKLSIIVNAKDPVLAEAFNLAVGQVRVGSSGGRSYNNGYTSAYTVDPDGNIQFPLLGDIHVAGLERGQVAAVVKDRLETSKMLKDPVVTVEFLNATVSVLGDVARPGEYPIDRDNLNILQAISKAGDLNITGMRENVLVVREENGENKAYRINLTATDSLMTSPAYYLQQNDVVYVEPNGMKKRQAINNANTVLTPSFWLSIASFLTTLAALIF